jgi:hypothetical protein
MGPCTHEPDVRSGCPDGQGGGQAAEGPADTDPMPLIDSRTPRPSRAWPDRRRMDGGRARVPAARRWARRSARTTAVPVAARRGIRSPIRPGADSRRIRSGFAGGGRLRRASGKAASRQPDRRAARRRGRAGIRLALTTGHDTPIVPDASARPRRARDPGRRAIRRRTNHQPDGRLPGRPRGDRGRARRRHSGRHARDTSRVRGTPRVGRRHSTPAARAGSMARARAARRRGR